MSDKAGRRGGKSERGAALVEMALVTPLLLMLVFGIIEFGVAFDRKIALNQGVREGARQGVVANWDGAPCGSSPTDKLVCLTEDRVGLDAGTTAVMIKVPGTYEVGEKLTVCASYPLQSITGLFGPITQNRFLHSEVTMRLEQKAATGLTTGGEDPPSGDTWSWCG